MMASPDVFIEAMLRVRLAFTGTFYLSLFSSIR